MATSDRTETATAPGDEHVVSWGTRLRYFLNGDFVRSAPYWGIPFAIMAVAVYGGIGWNVVLSFLDYSGLEQLTYDTWTLDNYVAAFESGAFRAALRNTVVLMVAFTAISLVLGLLLAILLDQQIRYREKFQTIYLLPMALSFVVTAQVWLWIYNTESGPINLFITALGFEPVDFIGNSSIALAAVMFALIWQFSGYTMVVYLAGLRSIPQSQFEAAWVDGASAYRTYLRVIVPQLKEASVSAAVVLMVFALKAFTFLYALTSNYRPPHGTDILATLMVRQAFQLGEWSYAAAIATMLLVMTLGIIGPYLYYQHRHGSL